MNVFQKYKLSVVTIVYWFLLAYIIAALLWWFIALNKQNTVMTELRTEQLKKDDPFYFSSIEKISNEERIKKAQYLGEGLTFLVLILIGALFVYQAVRRQIKLSQQQQNFMMAVTHELKTPIAVAKLNLETLQKRKLEIEQQQKLINNTLQETDRLNTLCNNILLAAQLDAYDYMPLKTLVDLSKLIENGTEEFKIRYAQRQVITTIQKDIQINGEQLLLQMLLSNLIENALKYSPKESIIKIELQQTENKIELKVIDEGLGIAEAEKKKIFQKFYRTGNENVRKAKGTGLGLYLCSKITQQHNGHISVANNLPQGSIFTATFIV
jgi:signal transduction histidine kinase